MKGFMNNPIRTISDMKVVKEGRLARRMCRLGKHRVLKSKGPTGETSSCARKGCEWSKT